MRKLNGIKYLLPFLFCAFVFFPNCIKDKELCITDPILKTKIYKTRADYFNYVNTWGTVNAQSTLKLSDSSSIAIINGDTVYKLRWRFENNYIMGLVVGSEDYFTNMTFSEIVSYNEKYPVPGYYPKDQIFKRVIDTNPFLEFYLDEDNIFYHRDSADISQINKIIKDGELGKYFKKIK